MRPVINIEISSLTERDFTGISNVARNLGREMLGDTTIEPAFWLNRQYVPNALAEKIVDLDGAPHLRTLSGRLADPKSASPRLARSTGIYPSAKPHRRFFEHETLIVHDLTAITMPQYHNPDTIEWENSRLLPDILSSDLLIAVSESTRRDIRDYYPQAQHIPVEVALLAPCCMPPDKVKRLDLPPYVVILGTLEPRKNVSAVLEMLQRDKTWLEAMSFVFVGRWGWGNTVSNLLKQYNLKDEVDRGTIQFPGFVTDEQRDILIANAQCLVYVSKYEGFGLPVMEGLSLGTPVVTGQGSSLPEAGGPWATYVDVSSPTAIAEGLRRAITENTPELARARQEWAANFTWRKTYEIIRDASLAGLARSREVRGERATA